MSGLVTFLNVNNVGIDSNFIRLKENKNMYVHLKSDITSSDERIMQFEFKHGYKGAICFLNDQADAFLDKLGEESYKLEKVRVLDTVPPDGSLN